MKIAIVTGASSGMGAEFVKQIDKLSLVDEIWAVARRLDRLNALETKTKLRPFACDLTVPAEVDAVVAALTAESPKVFMLVNCAGYAKFGSYADISAESELSMIELDVKAVVRMSRIAIPYMEEPAHIINIASTAAFQPLPYMNVYAASKSFVLSYSRALGYELQKSGIGVTAVCPGWTKTEFFGVAEKDAGKGAVAKFPFMSTPGHVVHKALKDALAGRELSVCGIFNQLQLFFTKIMPASLVMRVWDMIRK